MTALEKGRRLEEHLEQGPENNSGEKLTRNQQK